MRNARAGLGWIALSAIVLAIGCGKQPPRGPLANKEEVSKLRIAFGGSAAKPAENAPAAASATGNGWGKITGKFKINGTPPASKPINITASPEICMPGNKPVPSQTLLVDSGSKGIANIAIYARKTVRVHDSAKSPPADAVVFDQKDCLFASPLLAFVKGQKVRMKNSDPISHNINMTPKNGPAFNQLIPGGQEVPYAAVGEEALPVKVKCDIHPWMGAYTLARNTTYFAVTKTDGSFEIANLPDGEELEFQVWHERVASWDLQPAGVTWDKKGRFKVKLAENEEKKLEFEVPAAVFAAE